MLIPAGEVYAAWWPALHTCRLSGQAYVRFTAALDAIYREMPDNSRSQKIREQGVAVAGRFRQDRPEMKFAIQSNVYILYFVGRNSRLP